MTEAPCAVAAGRRALVFGAAAAPLLGWLELPAGAVGETAVLICNPLGFEAVNAHRGLRHLAEHLAGLGFPTLRFDYPGCGDSAQDEFDPDRIAAWTASIVEAARELRARTGCPRLAVIGLRLGAALAALAAPQLDAHWLVLWNPVQDGRQYARELRALAMLANLQPDADSTALEVGGFALARQTAQDLQQIDLLQARFDNVRGVLVVGRDDLAPDTRLSGHLREAGVRHEVLRLPGYAGLVAEATATEVPRQALREIGAWLRREDAACADAAPRGPALWPALPFEPTLEFAGLREQALWLGPRRELFGIGCTPAQGPDASRPLLVMLNSGSTHHVGPGRLYVRLAREYARLGGASLRFDLRGLGDSARAGVAEENACYPSSAQEDVLAVLADMRQRCGCTRFILLGLCSGAYNAFSAAQAAAPGCVVEVVLINPLTFRAAVPAQVPTAASRSIDWAGIKQRLGRWRATRRLVSVGAQLFRRTLFALRHLRLRLRARLGAWRADAGGEVARGLQQLQRNGCRVTLCVDSSGLGHDTLFVDAPAMAARAARDGWLRTLRIARSDHVFSTEGARRRLLDALREHLDGAREPS
jgi:alpha-beta hydrolase superfamily lysophospholipase